MVTIDDALKILKELNEADPEMMKHFLGTRFRTNEAVAAHPTVEVASAEKNGTKFSFIGVIGLLNGLFGHNKTRLAVIESYVCPFNREHKIDETKPQCPECRAPLYLEKIDFEIVELP